MTVERATTVPARRDSLEPALAFVEAFCTGHGVARDDVLRLALIVEELFTNTVVHGHGGDCDAPVRLELDLDAQRITLAYDDCAPPFDPVARGEASAADLGADAADAADVAERPVGQLGLALILSLVDEASYVRERDSNRLRLALRRQP